MSEQHTPGPWTLRSDPYGDGMPYFRISAGEGYYGDGTQGFGIAEIISEADAHLIAAAPDLLDACKFAFAAMNSEEGRRRASDCLVAAITQATGAA